MNAEVAISRGPQWVLLVGLHGRAAVQFEAIELCRRTGARVVARNTHTMVLQFTGTEAELDRFLAALPTSAVTQICRTELTEEPRSGTG